MSKAQLMKKYGLKKTVINDIIKGIEGQGQ